MKTSRQSRFGAFTMRELLVVIATIAVLAGIIIPATFRARSSDCRPKCVSNLRQAALAFIIWESDREQIRLHYRVDIKDGGTFIQADYSGRLPFNQEDRNQAWFQFAWLSNEMSSPKVLTCPADKAKSAANNWSAGTEGLLYPGNRNHAVSYALSLDAGQSGGKESPDMSARFGEAFISMGGMRILLSDRNLQANGTNDHCTSGVGLAAEIKTYPTATGWRRDLAIHGSSGNVALRDGSVQSVNDGELNALFAQSDDGSPVHAVHFLIP